MTKCWVTYVILRPGLLHHNYLIIHLKLKGFGVPMIRCLLTLRGLLARGSLYVVHNLRFRNNLDLTLSNAFMRPKVSIPISFVMSGDDSRQNLHAVLLLCYLWCTLVIACRSVLLCLHAVGSEVLTPAWRRPLFEHGGICCHQSITPRRHGPNHEPSDAGSPSKLHQWQ